MENSQTIRVIPGSSVNSTSNRAIDLGLLAGRGLEPHLALREGKTSIATLRRRLERGLDFCAHRLDRRSRAARRGESRALSADAARWIEAAADQDMKYPMHQMVSTAADGTAVLSRWRPWPCSQIGAPWPDGAVRLPHR